MWSSKSWALVNRTPNCVQPTFRILPFAPRGFTSLSSADPVESLVPPVVPQAKAQQRHITPFLIFDTAKDDKCHLTTKRKNILTWYSCGPTVYDSAHVGHASSFIRQDVVRRIVESLGDKQLSVIQVMGITDIDDKIIRRATERGTEWNLVSKHFEREFVEDLKSLNVLPPHVFSRVSDYIPQILAFVRKLVESGQAYEAPDGSVYFDTQKYGNRYGVFRQTYSCSDDGEEVASAHGKRNNNDFALWKGAKPGEPFWERPWGSFPRKGRPGWHIECSVMASHFFGSSLDLHTGGRDLIFPHHENEEAQCCAHFQSSQWTSHWLHMGHLHFKGDVKMSKSLGNTVSIREFLKQESPDVLRVMCIMAKYRKNIEYSTDTVAMANKIVKKLSSFLNDTSSILKGSVQVSSSSSQHTCLWDKLENGKSQLNSALMNDFDTPEALKIVTQLMSEFNRHHTIASNPEVAASLSPPDFQLVLAFKILIQDFVNLVGLSFDKDRDIEGSKDNAESRLEGVISQFVEFRNEVRSYSLAMDEADKQVRKERMRERKELVEACDKVRKDMLLDHGVQIKDHGKTSSWLFSTTQND